MGYQSKGFKVFQSGRESVRGNAVAATSKLAITDMQITPIDALERPKLAKGLLLANPGNELVVYRGVDWSIPSTPLVFDQFQQFLAMAVKGGVSPGAGPPYTWTYTRNPAQDPVLDSRTFEVRQSDGTTPNDWEFSFGMCSQLTISAAQRESVKFSAEGYGRRLQTSTLTAAQALPAITIPPIGLTCLDIDDDWASLGNTQVAGQVLGWSWTLGTGTVRLETADCRDDLDFVDVGMNADNVTLALEVMLLAKASAQWQTEKTKAEAAALRAVQVNVDVDANNSLTLKGLFKYGMGTVFPDGENEGLQVVNLRLEGSTDDTNFCEVVLTNGANALG